MFAAIILPTSMLFCFTLFCLVLQSVYIHNCTAEEDYANKQNLLFSRVAHTVSGAVLTLTSSVGQCNTTEVYGKLLREETHKILQTLLVTDSDFDLVQAVLNICRLKTPFNRLKASHWKMTALIIHSVFDYRMITD